MSTLKSFLLIFILSLSGCGSYKHLSTSEGVKDINHKLCYKKLYEQGVLEIDFKQALHWCTKAALTGNKNSHVLLAEVYLLADEPIRNYSKAHFWLNRATEGSEPHPHAAYLLYILYKSGIGVEPEQQVAQQWLIMASNLKHAKAMDILKAQ